MPNTVDTITRAKAAFYQKARLPRVTGSLDCTHIKIVRKEPVKDSKKRNILKKLQYLQIHEVMNGLHSEHAGTIKKCFEIEKATFSINVQTISSANLQILDIVARWPGSTH
ncbi:hypothetical protein NQ318_020393 [Aromia moschata]|uniref:Transposase n=1 Tax=Aromia moschata TaxID=1265417 RepID=A0AAV8Y4I7_9CUCU|nr:hypothetical protein NQ318_020393 [Aromia moschata]